MDKSRRILGESPQRTVSSGMIYDKKLTNNDKAPNSARLNEILLLLIEEEMELAFRSQNCLNNVGIKLIGQLVQKSASGLLALKNFGRKSLNEIETTLAEMGLTLEMNLDFPPWNGGITNNELIQILSLQRLCGGFLIDHKAAKILGGDFEKMNQEIRDAQVADNSERALSIYTEHLLHRLEADFENDIPGLTNLIQRHRKWLQRVL